MNADVPVSDLSFAACPGSFKHLPLCPALLFSSQGPSKDEHINTEVQESGNGRSLQVSFTYLGCHYVVYEPSLNDRVSLVPGVKHRFAVFVVLAPPTPSTAV